MWRQWPPGRHWHPRFWGATRVARKTLNNKWHEDVTFFGEYGEWWSMIHCSLWWWLRMAFEPLRRLFCIFSLRIVTTSTEKRRLSSSGIIKKMVKISIIYIALDVKITLNVEFFLCENSTLLQDIIAKVQPPPVRAPFSKGPALVKPSKNSRCRSGDTARSE